MFRIAVIIAVLRLAGCALDDDPCGAAVAVPMGSRGDAGFEVSIIAKETPRTSSNLALDCLRVTAVSSTNYSDTLLSAAAAFVGSRVTVGGMPRDTIDIVFDRERLFPIKISNLVLDGGVRVYDERLIMYPSSAPVVLPGQLYLNLKQGATIDQLEPTLSLFEGLTVHPEPGGYRLELEFTSRKRTAVLTEDLCRRLLLSPLVRAAGPMAGFSSVY